jgi:acetolactate synthase-1/2/3 large subunit
MTNTAPRPDDASPAPQPAPLSGARLVVEALEREGVTHIFGYPGSAS